MKTEDGNRTMSCSNCRTGSHANPSALQEGPTEQRPSTSEVVGNVLNTLHPDATSTVDDEEEQAFPFQPSASTSQNQHDPQFDRSHSVKDESMVVDDPDYEGDHPNEINDGETHHGSAAPLSRPDSPMNDEREQSRPPSIEFVKEERYEPERSLAASHARSTSPTGGGQSPHAESNSPIPRPQSQRAPAPNPLALPRTIGLFTEIELRGLLEQHLPLYRNDAPTQGKIMAIHDIISAAFHTA
jgi:hypothetical protein